MQIKIVDELASLKRPRKDELKRRLQLLIGRKRGQLHDKKNFLCKCNDNDECGVSMQLHPLHEIVYNQKLEPGGSVIAQRVSAHPYAA